MAQGRIIWSQWDRFIHGSEPATRHAVRLSTRLPIFRRVPQHAGNRMADLLSIFARAFGQPMQVEQQTDDLGVVHGRRNAFAALQSLPVSGSAGVLR
jgi:hypothetical protein